MATPSSPIGFGDIYSEANGAVPSSATSLAAITSGGSYFDGPNGSTTNAFNAWGQGYGDDGIYSVQALSATPIKFSDYRNVSYFYDQTNTQISFEVQNNNGGYAFDVTMDYMDTSLNYIYLSTNTGGLLGPSTTYGPTEASLSTTPLIYGCNWRLTINPDSGYTSPTATIRLDINGSTLFSGINIDPFPTPTILDYTSFANEYMTLDQPVSGATGSLVYIRIS
jgi:hypothetical protein